MSLVTIPLRIPIGPKTSNWPSMLWAICDPDMWCPSRSFSAFKANGAIVQKRPATTKTQNALHLNNATHTISENQGLQRQYSRAPRRSAQNLELIAGTTRGSHWVRTMGPNLGPQRSRDIGGVSEEE